MDPGSLSEEDCKGEILKLAPNCVGVSQSSVRCRHLNILPLQLWLGSRLLYPPACNISTLGTLENNPGNLDFFCRFVNSGLYLPLVKHSWVLGLQQGEDMKGGPSRAHPRSRRICDTEEGHLWKLASLLLQLQLSLVPGLLGGVPCAHYHQVPEWEASLNQKNDKVLFSFFTSSGVLPLRDSYVSRSVRM